MYAKPSDVSVLEIGPGTNRRYPFRPKAPWGNEAVFLDLEKPSDEVKSLGHWVLGDAQNLPFKDAVFTWIIASHIIEHLEDPLKFLNESRRVIKSRGCVDIYAPNFISRNARADPDHKHVFNVFALLRAAWKIDFKVRFPVHVGTKLPSNLQRILNLAINLVLDEIHIRLIKQY
jgi:SAM-dependent methyltransferase